MIRHAAICAVLVTASSCLVGGGTRTVTAAELRAQVVGMNLASLDPGARRALESGQVWVGATEAQLYVARGEPRLWWNTMLGGMPCRVLVHHGSDPDSAEMSATTCNGYIVQTAPISPKLPCWRLSEVGPRIAANVGYFESRPLDRQWQIVIGILQRGQAQQDVTIAFGAPYNRGFDEREDGRRAEELIFLDRSGDAYGINVTLINGAVVGWKMSAERRLTPEAEQRRLDAIAKKLTDKLAEMERRAAQQHAETVGLFNQVMERQDQMLGALTQPPPSMPATSPAPAPDVEPSEPVLLPANGTTTNNGITTTVDRRPAPRNDFMEKRNACRAVCEQKRDAQRTTCTQRWDASRCPKNDSDCQVAMGIAHHKCTIEYDYFACANGC